MRRRIYGLILQEIYITKRSLEVIIDTVWFSVLSVIAFGYVAKFISKGQPGMIGDTILAGMIFWEVIRINQYSLSLNPLWNIWSGNFCNMFIAPISKTEYLIAQFIVAFFKSIFIFIINSIVAYYIFGFNILTIKLPVLVYIFINLSIFAWAIGLIFIGIVFTVGTRIQAIAWGALFLMQPLMAVFYPVTILPASIQFVAFLLPPTYIFELLRSQMLAGENIPGQFYFVILIFNLVILIGSLFIYEFLFRSSQMKGQFAKNDEG